MAETSFDFRNLVGSKKCAVSPSRIVSLEIRDESPDVLGKCAFDGFFCNTSVSGNINSEHTLFRRHDKESYQNYLNGTRSSSPAFISDKRCSDNLSSVNGTSYIDVNLLELLNSPKSEEADVKNFACKKNTSGGKMKIISNLEGNDGLSELSPPVTCDRFKTAEVNATVKHCLQKNIQNCDIPCPDSEFEEKKCPDSVFGKLSKSSVAEEGNLSDLLSSLNFEDSNVKKCRNLNSSCMSVTKEEPCLSDILLSISHEASSVNKNKNFYPNVCHAKVAETEKESCLADLLSSINIHKPASNSLPLNTGISNSCLKNVDDAADLLKDFTFDVQSCSSSNSCASSLSETEDHSPKGLLANNHFTNDSDSGFGSFNSENKEFSFFDYSSDTQMSFNKFLSNKSDVSTASKQSGNENAEEMSMSDLMIIVSPEFKNPSLSTLNKSGDKDTSSMLDLLESLNSEPKNCNSYYLNSDSEKDGKMSNNIQNSKEVKALVSGSFVGKEGMYSERNDITVDEDKVMSDDEQTADIDLRACIKSSTHESIHASPIKQFKCSNDQRPECYSPYKTPFYCEDYVPSDLSQSRQSPFIFNDTVPIKKPRINSKQTLFCKALSCKPKKDPFLLQKVASIKNELLGNIMCRPVYIDCDVPQPIVEPVQQSDRCILSLVGRRTFGLDASCELQ